MFKIAHVMLFVDLFCVSNSFIVFNDLSEESSYTLEMYLIV